MKYQRTLSFALLMAIGSYCYAQTPNPVATTQQRQGDQATLEEVLKGMGVEEAFATGSYDLFILKRRNIFFFESDTRLNYTNNAFLSDAKRSSDTYLQQQVSVKIETRVARKYDVTGGITLQSVRYHKNGALDHALALLNLGVSRQVDHFRLGATIEFDHVMSRGFGTKILEQWTPMVYAAYPLQINTDTAVIPRLYLARSITSPGDYRNNRLGAAVSLFRRLSQKVQLEATIGSTVREYDHYFPAVNVNDRRDKTFDIQIGISWTPVDEVVVRVEAKGSKNKSTINDLDAHEVAIVPSVNIRIPL